MICPICKFELKDSMIVLNLTKKGIKEFHLANAHTHNLLHDLIDLVHAMAFHHRTLKEAIPFGDMAVELSKYATEIFHAETEEWEGENE